MIRCCVSDCSFSYQTRTLNTDNIKIFSFQKKKFKYVYVPRCVSNFSATLLDTLDTKNSKSFILHFRLINRISETYFIITIMLIKNRNTEPNSPSLPPFNRTNILTLFSNVSFPSSNGQYVFTHRLRRF